MPVTERDRRRLDALIALVKPANSLAARLDTLSDDQRDWLEGWKAHCDRWMRRNGERAYELTLNGFGPVGLRKDIAASLFGSMPIITDKDDDKRAAEIYQRYCHE